MVVLCDFDLSKTKAGSMDWVFVCMICNSTGLLYWSNQQNKHNEKSKTTSSSASFSPSRCRRIAVVEPFVSITIKTPFACGTVLLHSTATSL
jgi:hypothetical protein